MRFRFSDRLELEDNRAFIRPLEESDFDYLLPICLEFPDLIKFSPAHFGSKEALQQYFDTAFRMKVSEQRYPFIIFDKENEQYAGSTSFGNISNKDVRLEIGWTWIARNLQRTGLNRHCKFLMLQHAFEDLGTQRVEFRTDGRNTASRTAMEKIGAKYEGTLRSHTVMVDGHRRDTIYYSILADEWPEIRNSVFSQMASF